MKAHITNQKGFTLIELLVTISIISMLSSVAYAGYGAIKSKSRDTKRAADTVQLRTALTSYEIDHGGVPAGSAAAGCTGSPDNVNPVSWTCSTPASLNAVLTPLVTGKYISSVPTDPLNTGGYSYYYSSGAQNNTDPVTGTALAQNASFNYVNETQTASQVIPVILGINVGTSDYTTFPTSGYPADIVTSTAGNAPVLGKPGQAALQSNGGGPIGEPLAFTVNTTNPNGYPWSYTMNWGDGTSDTTVSSLTTLPFSHAYSAAFNGNVTLSVTYLGQTSNTQNLINVYDATPVIQGVSGLLNPAHGSYTTWTVQLQNNHYYVHTGDTWTIKVDWGDGTSVNSYTVPTPTSLYSTGPTVGHNYATAGTKIMTVTGVYTTQIAHIVYTSAPYTRSLMVR